ncbi:MAG: transketolase [Rickettsiales bacterium]
MNFLKMNKENLANALRFLAIDAVDKANSGHPGMPMGMADVATILFTEFLKFNPKQPKWHDRDRFILSAGHGSMLLYALLFLTGYEDINLDDIKNFRQLHSKCAGHPEFGELEGIETTTGPLGQGVANAVGMAISEKMLKARFGEKIYNHKIYALVGDGCLMEGISQEALSIAGHLQLNNLVVIWDNNSISIDGNTNIATSENMHLRFQALGFEVIAIDGHNFEEIRQAFVQAQNASKPILIDCKTTIGYGSPSKAGSQHCHGSPLGKDETQKTRENLGWNHPAFEIPANILEIWRQSATRCKADFERSQNNLNNLSLDLKTQFNNLHQKNYLQNLEQIFTKIENNLLSTKANQATRKSSQQVLDLINKELGFLIGGSADLTESVLTKTATSQAITAQNFAGNYLHYGVREHAMGAIMNGIALHGNFIPYGGTFLVFSDYLKPAIRLSALMKRQIIYVFTHDSIGLGEDGPTHQPIEHLAMLRSIPNLNVFRPCDLEETIACYKMALSSKQTPSALILSRQNLPHQEKSTRDFNRGAYEISANQNPNVASKVILLASGSEVELAVLAKNILVEKNIETKVISVPCLELFLKQDIQYQNQILGKNFASKIVYCAIEAGVKFGWHEIIGNDGVFVGMNSFGASAKAQDLYNHFGITPQKIVDKILSKI